MVKMTVTLLKSDFSGYATKANLKCTDGRTIMPEAFKHMDGMQVPLVWQHGHKDPANVLGHAVLEARPDGVYCHGYFNDTPQGQTAKALVAHKDVNALSIFANQLVERSKQVFHGIIREVSICLAGANPGAFIDNVTIQHSDGELEELEDAAIMHFGLEFDEIAHDDDEEFAHATIQEVYDSLTDEQKDVVNYMIGAALEGAASDSAEHGDNTGGDNADTTDEDNLEHKEGSDMTRNVFEQQNSGGAGTLEKHELSHADIRSIMEDAESRGSLKAAVEQYALSHGIENLEVLFPEARNLTNTPEWNKRQTEWVAGVLGGTKKSPFSRIRSVVADITMESARALGYIKGNMKKEEWFSVSARTTTPTTVYKKQKLDRDDIIDITDFDVVPWMRGEMRMMLEEELARAILIGDGRPVEDPANPGQPNPDKIKDPAAANDGAGIRSILNEHELYATTININLGDGSSDAVMAAVDQIIASRKFYRGTGTPTLYTTEAFLTQMLLVRNGFQQRMWKTEQELAAELRVDKIVTVEVMETMPNLFGIIVNLADYNIGADKGGEVSLFDDFDIDFNQYKYLIETRISGALVKIKSAIVVKVADSTDTLITPTAPTFNENTGVVTIPTQSGVTYKNGDTGATLTAGAQPALDPGESLLVVAEPDSTHYFANSEVDDWTFTRPTA
jgi:HK97 family phage prohead protease